MTEPDPAPDTPHQAVWAVTEPVYEADVLNPELAISPWQSHRDFAYDLVSFVQPRLIVELGVHYGCSYYAFCQAVKDRALTSRVVGIDTWKGDPHAGFYDDDVFDLVKKTKESYFSDDRFSFLRASFDEAVAEFADDSIELLHIDGLHTYESRAGGFHHLAAQAGAGRHFAHPRRCAVIGLRVCPLLGGYQAAVSPFRVSESMGPRHRLSEGRPLVPGRSGRRRARQDSRLSLSRGVAGLLQAGAIDLQWQKEQTDLWWQESEKVKKCAGQESEKLRKRAEQLEKWLRICTIGVAGAFLRSRGD